MARDRGRWLTGGIIVLIGLFFLLDTTNVLDTTRVFTFVPSVVIVLGLYMLIRHRFRHLFGPGVILLFGIAWQLVALEYYSFGELFGTYWPILVILFGLSLLVGRRQRRRARAHVQVDQATDGNADDEVDLLTILGDTDRRVSGDRFDHADVTTVLGDSRLDLRAATVEGTASVDTVVVLGDVEVAVPEDWVVQFDTVNLLGETEDRRPQHSRNGRPDLVVSGVLFLGDVTVRD